MSELTELEKKIRGLVCSSTDEYGEFKDLDATAKEIASLIESEKKKVWDAAREGMVSKEEYEDAVNRIGELQEQLEDSEHEIRSLSNDLKERGREW